MRATCLSPPSFFFFFNDTATTKIYPLSLHDPLPISPPDVVRPEAQKAVIEGAFELSPTASARLLPPLTALGVAAEDGTLILDRKRTRLNSSHLVISYAVFCLKKKKER